MDRPKGWAHLKGKGEMANEYLHFWIVEGGCGRLLAWKKRRFGPIDGRLLMSLQRCVWCVHGSCVSYQVDVGARSSEKNISIGWGEAYDSSVQKTDEKQTYSDICLEKEFLLSTILNPSYSPQRPDFMCNELRVQSLALTSERRPTANRQW